MLIKCTRTLQTMHRFQAPQTFIWCTRRGSSLILHWSQLRCARFRCLYMRYISSLIVVHFQLGTSFIQTGHGPNRMDTCGQDSARPAVVDTGRRHIHKLFSQCGFLAVSSLQVLWVPPGLPLTSWLCVCSGWKGRLKGRVQVPAGPSRAKSRDGAKDAPAPQYLGRGHVI